MEKARKSREEYARELARLILSVENEGWHFNTILKDARKMAADAWRAING